MAESSVPGGSLSAGSEPVYDIVCQPCSTEGKIAEAEGFCDDCREHLCSQCIGFHGKLAMSKHHRLLGKDAMPRKHVMSPVKDVCTERCSLHKDEVIKFFCPTHLVLGCSVCVTLKHSACGVDYIPDVVKNLASSPAYTEYKAKIVDLIQKSKNRSKFSQDSLQSSSDCLSTVIHAIETYRDEIVNAIIQRADELKDQAKKLHSQDADKMKTIADTSSQALTELQAIVTSVDTLIQKKQLCQAFVQMKNNARNITRLQGVLDGTDDAEVTDYEFWGEEKLRGTIGRGRGLGTLVVKSSKKLLTVRGGKQQTAASKSTAVVKDATNINATYKTNINANSSDNKNVCHISGMAVVTKEKIVVADYSYLGVGNGTVKLIDVVNNKVISEFKPKKAPWDVAVSGDTVVATIPNACEILFLKHDGGLVRDRVVRVNGQCRGINCHDNKLYVVFDQEEKLEVLSMAGVVMQRFDRNDQTGPLFYDPTYVTVSAVNQSIYVSEWNKEEVKVLDMEGKLTSVYRDGDLKWPRQLAVHHTGAIYLCDPGNDLVHLLSPQCTKVKRLLTKQDGLNNPRSVCYCQDTGRLYVGMYRSDFIKVYQVS